MFNCVEFFVWAGLKSKEGTGTTNGCHAFTMVKTIIFRIDFCCHWVYLQAVWILHCMVHWDTKVTLPGGKSMTVLLCFFENLSGWSISAEKPKGVLTQKTFHNPRFMTTPFLLLYATEVHCGYSSCHLLSSCWLDFVVFFQHNCQTVVFH